MTIEIPDDATYEQALNAARVAVIQAAIGRAGSKAGAARALSLSRRCLYKVLERLSIAGEDK